MKRSPSIVWRFFDRLTDGNRCLGVVCKLCSTQYKFFGNTTNLRVHLINKHAIQWELAQNGHFDEAFQVDDASNQSISKRSYRARDKHVRYSVNVDLNKTDGNETIQDEEKMPYIEIQRVNVIQNSDAEDYNEDDEATINMVRQMHAQESDEEWLDETAFAKQPEKRKRFKVKKIKREVTSPVPRRSSTFYIQNQSKHEPSASYISEPSQDEYSVFGEYIANKLRKIKTPRTRGNIQQMITTILWQAEYGFYDQADSVKRMLLLSMQEQDTSDQIMETNVQEEVQEMQEEPNQSIEETELIVTQNQAEL